MQVTSTSLNYKKEIWLELTSDKLQDIWQEVKKKKFLFYKLKLFIKEHLTTTDKTIKNNIDFINSLKILKNR